MQKVIWNNFIWNNLNKTKDLLKNNFLTDLICQGYIERENI